ncbi:MAG: hypothetical protein CL670_08935 [Balneola sp.]|jgi:hypothetical protein|nr:hypothetical protein [Balneola sp.]MBE79263.1 hypothetical protein [Balneola sp.]|tara:strand:- start:4077 stop:4502 length:426 start_codon:yes stop_codon:yes gene_type:complete
MNDISDILFLSAAMVIFSMLTINTTRSFQSTSNTVVRSDLEYRAISIAQDEIDDIRWAPEEEIDPYGVDYLYGGNDEVITKSIEYGFDDEYSESFEITRSSTQIENSSDQNRYKVTILVESENANPAVSVQMEYIKTYFKD